MTAPRDAGAHPLRVALVCLGNICRSPMADVVLNERIRAAGLTGAIRVESCGTGDWHVGEPIDDRAGATLRAAGYDPSGHRARSFGPEWFDHDLILAMDRANLRDVRDRLPAGAHPRTRLFRDYDPAGAGEVPDPYYGGPEGFAEVLAMVERTADALLEILTEETGATG